MEKKVHGENIKEVINMSDLASQCIESIEIKGKDASKEDEYMNLLKKFFITMTVTKSNAQDNNKNEE